MKKEVIIYVFRYEVKFEPHPFLYQGKGKVELEENQINRLIEKLPEKNPQKDLTPNLYLIEVCRKGYGIIKESYIEAENNFETVEYIENLTK